MKANGFRCDHMHEWATLHAGENGRVDLLGEFLFAHDDAATRPAQTLVRSSGDKLRVRDRTGMLTACYKSCDVRHVDEQNRANRISDLAQSRKIDDTRISGGTGGDHCWADVFGLLLQRVVIDLLGLLANAVLRDRVKFAGEIRGMPMREMPTVREIHRKDLA